MTPAQIAEATLKAAQVQAAAAQSQTIAAWVGTVGGLLTLGANVLFAIRSGERERRADEQAQVREERAESAAQDRIRAEDEAARRRTEDELRAAEAREAAARRARVNGMVTRATDIGDRAVVLLQEATNRVGRIAVAGAGGISSPVGAMPPEYHEDLLSALQLVIAEAGTNRPLWTAVRRLDRAMRGDDDGRWRNAFEPAEVMNVLSARREIVFAARNDVGAFLIGDDEEIIPTDRMIWGERPK